MGITLKLESTHEHLDQFPIEHVSSLKKENVHFLGAVSLCEEPSFEFFKDWVDEGKHASMDWIKRYEHVRANPKNIYEGAEFAFLFGFSYFHGTLSKEQPQVAQYAQMKDYHRFLKAYGEQIAQGFRDQGYQAQVLVDTAPVLEKALTANFFPSSKRST